MAKVHLLPPDIVSKIAAGEVIERPASVVKELLENSLDAGAGTIDIYLEHAGKKLITLRDSGTGIDPDDLEKIFLRHATSKIDNIGDLFAVDSLGFRGEALYSIAAVADVQLQSKTAEHDTGWLIHVRGGEKKEKRPVSMNQGTHIDIRELFFNTPARKKFLKTDSTELGQIIRICTPYALLRPDIRMTLMNHTRVLIDTPAQKTIPERIESLLKLDAKHVIETGYERPEGDLVLSLFLGDINVRRPRKDLQYLFVNGRPVANHTLSFHLNQIYRHLLPPGVHPFFIVSLSLPPSELDVNVHPTKREVKLKHETEIIRILRRVCENALVSDSKAKQAAQPFTLREPSVEGLRGEEAETAGVSPDPAANTPPRQYTLDTATPSSTPAAPAPGRLKDLLTAARYIGPFRKKYLLFEADRSLLIIDQHAAQERITYEQLLTQASRGRVESQRLLEPVLVRVSAQEILLWEILESKLEKLGFSTTKWSPDTLAVHAHPALITEAEIALRNLLTKEERTGFNLENLARRACKDSLTAGYRMDPAQAKFIMRQLCSCADPFVCPHGRPTVAEIREHTFEREFLRR
ncbi:MAG: DNA mismatch repair endonuclease MutL [Candidatus Omnitrophica bacterium]|nr:DNA mismatch repair endonuclease MutL [Candidatus Omnitrophota bacterium]